HEPHATTATPDQVISYQALLVEQDEVTVLMLACMTLELQKEMENCNAYDMIKELRNMFQT
ncbi:hypothetical protein Tco_1344942, partial [Tanacetum coccineum]